MPIKSFYDDKSDNELEKISDILENLSYVNDVRDYIREIISLNQIDYERANKIFEEFKLKNNLNKITLRINIKDNKQNNSTYNTISSVNRDCNIIIDNNNDTNRNEIINKEKENKMNKEIVNYDKITEKFVKNNLKILHVEKTGINKIKINSINKNLKSKSIKNKLSNVNIDTNFKKRIKTETSKENSLNKNSTINYSSTTKNSQTGFFKKNLTRESSFKKNSIILTNCNGDNINGKIKNKSIESLDLKIPNEIKFNNISITDKKLLNSNSNKISNSNLKIVDSIKRPSSVCNKSNSFRTNYFSLKNSLNVKILEKNQTTKDISENTQNINSKLTVYQDLNKKNSEKFIKYFDNETTHDNKEESKNSKYNENYSLRQNKDNILKDLLNKENNINLPDENKIIKNNTNISDINLTKQGGKILSINKNKKDFSSKIKINYFDKHRNSFNLMDLKKAELKNNKINFQYKNILSSPITVRNVSSSQKIIKNEKQFNVIFKTDQNNKSNPNKNLSKTQSKNKLEKLDDYINISSSLFTARNIKNPRICINENYYETNFNNSKNHSKDKFSSIIRKNNDQIKNKISNFPFCDFLF